MSLDQEKMQILKMVENGQITADEAAQLLDAVGEKDEIINFSKKPVKKGGKVLRVRVYEGSENIKVNVNLPLRLVEVLVDIGIKFLPVDKYPDLNKINMDELKELIEAGIEGKIVDIDSADGTKVEVFIE
ncbi:MAG: SHOCT-like domain-containing protein [Clostridia bacterium]